MKNKQENLRIELEENLHESIKEQEIGRVIESIQNILDDCNLSPIEILGILEVIRHDIHEEIEFICEEKKQ